MNPLFVTAFFDGRPGHEKQTRGILNGLAARTKLEISSIQLPSPTFGRRIRQWLQYLARFQPNARHRNHAEQTDLILGTGSYTHIPMLILKRRCRAKVVTCMTPDPFLKNRIDLCCIPRHDHPAPADNVLVTDGPPNTAVNLAAHDDNCGLILVGGIDVKSHHWDSRDTMSRIDTLIRQDKRVWTISSSPRTPADMIELLEAYSQNHSDVTFFRAEDTPQGWIETEYNRNTTVWVTADSVSMLYEALTAGCKVGVLPVRWKRKNNKFKTGIDHLVKNGHIRTYDIWAAGNPPPTSPPLDEAGRCASEILKKWWPERQ